MEAIRTTHSVADAICLCIETPAARVFHTGDFKIDYTPIDGEPIDFAKLAELGKKGVDLMMADSTNVLRPGFTPSERVVGETLDGIFREAKNRIIIATFSSNVHRVQKIIELAVKYGRKVAVSGRSMDKIAKIIISGKTNDITFTIPEGYTEYDIATKLSKLGIVNKSTFVEALESGDYTSSYSFLKKAQSGKHNLEGYLFPSTYTLPADSSSDAIIKAMLNKYNSVFTSEYKAKAKKLGYSENEIMIIASIIEKESGVDKDREKIASVIYNRLKINMGITFVCQHFSEDIQAGN